MRPDISICWKVESTRRPGRPREYTHTHMGVQYTCRSVTQLDWISESFSNQEGCCWSKWTHLSYHICDNFYLTFYLPAKQHGEPRYEELHTTTTFFQFDFLCCFSCSHTCLRSEKKLIGNKTKEADDTNILISRLGPKISIEIKNRTFPLNPNRSI
jgi:hypothetical protein